MTQSLIADECSEMVTATIMRLRDEDSGHEKSPGLSSLRIRIATGLEERVSNDGSVYTVPAISRLAWALRYRRRTLKVGCGGVEVRCKRAW